MPRADGTGPVGMGPTGWRRNGCIMTNTQGGAQGRMTNQPFGFGPGCGMGFGRGVRSRRFFGYDYSNTNIEPNSEDLTIQANNLEAQAAQLRNLADQRKKQTD